MKNLLSVQGKTFLGVLLADQRVRGIGKANIAHVVTLTSKDLKEVQNYAGEKCYNEKALLFAQSFIKRTQEIPGTKQKSLYNYFPCSIEFAKTIEVILKINQARDDSIKLAKICEIAPFELHWARRKQKVPKYVQKTIMNVGFLSKKLQQEDTPSATQKTEIELDEQIKNLLEWVKHTLEPNANYNYKCKGQRPRITH